MGDYGKKILNGSISARKEDIMSHLVFGDYIFFSLVCESFGVWTPFALSTLSTIADRTTVKSGIPRQLARKQLLQRLSVTLWRYNAKMILRHYGLCPEDGIDLLN